MSRSLNPTPSIQLYAKIVHDCKIFNLKRKQKGQKEVSLKWYCYNINFDLSGKTKVNNPYL